MQTNPWFHRPYKNEASRTADVSALYIALNTGWKNLNDFVLYSTRFYTKLQRGLGGVQKEVTG